ncbi:MAG TPA: hypothetical protein VFK50_06815 [Sphingomicrobium sp.]|nr:hypothetical protein [Sphingomicrobium sp.]
MVARIRKADILVQADIVAAPAQRACTDHSFEMPAGVYVAMAVLLFGFLAVMTIGFGNPGLAVPMGVNLAFLAAFFAVPAIFVRTTRDGSKAMRWTAFMDRGIDTETGHASGGEALTLTLLLPACILFWGIAVVTIAALV